MEEKVTPKTFKNQKSRKSEKEATTLRNRRASRRRYPDQISLRLTLKCEPSVINKRESYQRGGNGNLVKGQDNGRKERDAGQRVGR